MLIRSLFLSAMFVLALTPAALAQTGVPSADRIIRFTGTLPGAASLQAQPLRFAVYDAEAGGSLLWEETQAATFDAAGNYAVFLGGTSSDGLPLALFASGKPRWLSVERDGVATGPRVLLAAVPYAVAAATAGNAASLGGRPASDYLLSPTAGTDGTDGADGATPVARNPTPSVNNGTAGFIGKFFNTVDLDNSALFQSGLNIGLGTTTPLDTLHTRFLNTAGSATGYAVQNLGSTANSYSGMLFYDHTGALRQFQGYNNGTGEYRINNISPSGSINFMIGSDSKFKVATSGDIGLGSGTITPNKRLENYGNVINDVTFISHRHGGTISSPAATAAGANLFRFEGGGHTGSAFTSERGFLQIIATETWTPAANGTEVNFGTTANGTTTTSTRMTIAGNGNVGIGTQSPDVQLEVAGHIRATGGDFQPLDTGSFGVRWVNTAGLIQAHMHRFNSDNRLYVTNAGGSNLTGVYLASGGTSWTSTSDERLKRNITPLSGLLSKIKGIRVAAYDMAAVSAGADGATVDTSTTHHEIGSIAQDWLKDFPELVAKPKDATQFYGLDYDRIGVVALGAVKELNAIVEQKDAEIKALTERLSTLESMLKTLTTAVQQQQQR